MKSPFPGMDPYLEQHWRDVHSDLVALTRTALNGDLPDDLVARMEERVVIDAIHYERPRVIFPDVRVYEDPGFAGGGVATLARQEVAEPIVLEFDTEQHTESYVNILDASGGELITVIEFISPQHKLPGDSCEQYRIKRETLREAHVNIVEIDLVRQGAWWELLRPTVAPGRIQTAYRVIIWREKPSGRVELYPIALRNRLPIIPIPLRATDAPITLDLQSLIEQVYRNGRYNRTDYRKLCDPPLDDEDTAWVNERLAVV